MKNVFGKVGDGFKSFGSKIKNPFAKNNDNKRGGGDLESGFGSAPSSGENSTSSSSWANRNPFARKAQPENNNYAAAAAPAPASAPPLPARNNSENPFRKNPFRK